MTTARTRSGPPAGSAPGGGDRRAGSTPGEGVAPLIDGAPARPDAGGDPHEEERLRLPAEPVVAALVIVSTGSMAHLVLPGVWLLEVAVLVLALSVAGWTLRHALPRRPVLTTAALALLGAWAIVLRYGDPEGLAWWPSPEALRNVADLARAGVEVIEGSRVPVEPAGGVGLLVVCGAVAVLLATDHLAAGRRLPAVAGIPVLALWTPVATLRYSPPWFLFALAGALYLLLLTTRHRPPRWRPQAPERPSPWTAVPVAVVAVLTATVLAGLTAGQPGWRALVQTSPGPSGVVQLSVALDMREPLGLRPQTPVLRHQGAGGDLGPVRMYTVTQFDGRSWQPPAEGTGVPVGSQVLWPQALGETLTDPLEVSVELIELVPDRLPLPVMPRAVDAPGAWRYDELRDEVLPVGTPAPGLRYRMTAWPHVLTAQALAAAPEGPLPADPDALAVPDTSHREDVAALAREVTADASDRLEQAAALQAFLRSPGFFTYDLAGTPESSDDAVWDFLQHRAGYCVQFATAMTVMARSLGIPARVGVGFLPGEPDGSGDHVVTAEDAHAWPELYFPGTGWVYFEPTPAIHTGAPPAYSRTEVVLPPEFPTALPTDVPTDVPTPTPTPTLTPPSSSGPGASTGPSAPWLLGAAGVLVLVGVVRAAFLRVRRSRERLDPERAWSLVRRRLRRRGLVWTPSTTPRAVDGVLDAQLRARTGQAMDPDAREAMVDLARAVERSRYAPAPEPVPGPELAALVDRVSAGVRTQERAARRRRSERVVSGRARRGGGPNAPRGGS